MNQIPRASTAKTDSAFFLKPDIEINFSISIRNQTFSNTGMFSTR